MAGYTIVENGVSHKVTVANGKTTYDPPLPEPEKHRSKLDTMLAEQSPPRVMTDTVFFAGVGTLDQQIKDDRQLKAVVKAARKRGYNPSPNDFYHQGLARFVGDPLAFIPATGGRGHVKRVLAQRGMKVSSSDEVTVDQPESDPYEKPKHKLHPRLVNRILKRKLKANPGLAAKDRRELKEEIVAKHGTR